MTAAVVGTIDAFALPAAGVLPRLFVHDDDLPKAMALRTSATQIITLAGGPVSGLLVTTIGLPGTLLVDATTFTLQFAVLLLLKPPYDVPPQPQTTSGRGEGFVGEVVDGVRVAWRDPVLRLVLVVVGVVAAFVLPVTSLCVPLIGRANGWTAGHTGLVVGGSVAGSLLVTVVVARCGTYRRPGHAAALGCLLAAAGITGLAIAPSVAATVVQGLGVGLFTSHLAPVFVRSTPRSYLTRLQSLLSLVQTVPLLASTNLLASLNLTHALTLSAAATACAAVLLLRLEPVVAAERRTAA
jgi:hypothetical protein